MKLTHAQIQNFKSILDTGKFSISDLCCLVGKNEAGKTATLSAIQSIRPYGDPQTSFDVTEDYPRRFMTAFDERHPEDDAEVVKTWWQLSDEAYDILAGEFGADTLTSREFTISKRYNQKGTTWWFSIDEAKALVNIAKGCGLSKGEIAALSEYKTVGLIIEAIDDLDESSDEQDKLAEYLKQFRKQSVICRAIDLVSDLVPHFFYTSHYDRMNGQLSINQIVADEAANSVEAGDQIFLDFLRFSGTSLDDLKKAPRYEELNAKCEAASANITDQIFEYWSQNEYLQVKVELSAGLPDDPHPFNSGPVARARVMNMLHRASVPFSERSAGFVWFFSFLVEFAMMRKDTNNIIVLLDEPGLTLHGKAQSDLLRYIEEKLLDGGHQVIFSTHSPFMVPPTRLSDCRIVEDVIVFDKRGRPKSEGTRISDDVMSTDKDTLFPLQGALGYDITQTLFVGEKTILVEGTSDILYIQALSNELDLRGRTPLDARWTLCPAGGIDNLKPFVSLFGGNHIDLAVLSDQADGDKAKIERLRRAEILAADRMYTLAELLGQKEADIEDIFPPSLFAQIVNHTYELTGKNSLTAKKLHDAADTERQVKKAEAYFNLLPEKFPTFSHYRPADWLIKNSAILSEKNADTAKALDTAEEIFKIYNAMLE